VLFQNGDGQQTADPAGASPKKLAAVAGVVEASWTVLAAPLLHAQQSLWIADGDGPRKLADGDFGQAVLGPAPSLTVAFTRTAGLWTATVSGYRSETGRALTLDEAGQVVAAFMKARIDGKADLAQGYLTPSGAASYAPGAGPQLVRTGLPKLSRSFTVFSQIQGGSAYFVVRLDLADATGKDVNQMDEVLTVVHEPDSDKAKIANAVAGSNGAYAAGPSVIAVSLEPDDVVRVTFDSDLQPDTVAANVIMQRLTAAGAVSSGATLKGRDVLVNVKGLGAFYYRVSVLPGLKDKKGNGAATEYDLQLGLHASAPAATPTPNPSSTP
jgi:hypothetical protein